MIIYSKATATNGIERQKNTEIKNQNKEKISTDSSPEVKTQSDNPQDKVTLSGKTEDPTYSKLVSTQVKSNNIQTMTSNVTPQAAGQIVSGANTALDRINTVADATKIVSDVKNAKGTILRIQITHAQLNDKAQTDKINAMLNAGDKNNVHIQVVLRDDSNGGGGTVLTGDKLKTASDDIKKIIGNFSTHASFWLDTFNEGGTSASQDWADMESTLIKSARDAGYKGSIIVEDSNWGGGLTTGPESGLVKFSAQLNKANGNNSPALIGSIHEYSNDSDASKRLTDELNALKSKGYKLQIGEVGNANWLGGSNFEHRNTAIKAVNDNLGILRAEGASVLPWMDQFQSDGSMRHDVGLKEGDRFQ